MYLQIMILLALGLAIVITIAVLIFYKKPKSKSSKKVLKKGDYVMLKKSFTQHYPGVPTNYALVIDELTSDEAIVVYMDLKNQVLRENISLKALTKAV